MGKQEFENSFAASGQSKEAAERGTAFYHRGQGSAGVRFADCFARRDKLGLTELLVPLERRKREELIPLLTQWVEILSQALAVRAGQPGRWEAARQLGRSRTSAESLRALRSLRRAIELLQGNVSPGAVCGVLQVWLDVTD